MSQILFLVAIARVAVIQDDAAAITEVTYSYTNLAKMRPKETIVVRREAKGFSILATVESREKGGKTVEGKADLSTEEWESIAAVIREKKLLEWKAKEGPKATDSPRESFSIKGKRENSQEWGFTPVNEEAPFALWKRLLKIAGGKEDLKKVPLAKID